MLPPARILSQLFEWVSPGPMEMQERKVERLETDHFPVRKSALWVYGACNRRKRDTTARWRSRTSLLLSPCVFISISDDEKYYPRVQDERLSADYWKSGYITGGTERAFDQIKEGSFDLGAIVRSSVLHHPRPRPRPID